MGLQLPGELVTILQDLGYNWPEADEEKLFDLGGVWMSFAGQLEPVAQSASSAAEQVWNQNTGAAIDAFKAKWQADGSPGSSLEDSVVGAEMIGPLLMVAAGVVLALKINVIVQLVTLAIEMVQAIATAAPTFGASLLEIPVFKEITGRLVNLLISLAMEAILG
jgi:hypothetical protein